VQGGVIIRSLTSTLEAAQKVGGKALCKLVLTQGATTKTYNLGSGSNRILRGKHLEAQYNHAAEVVLDNADGTVSALNLEGYKGVISYGYTTSGGDEYSATAPLWVVGQQSMSWRSRTAGRLDVSLALAGIPNFLKQDRASSIYEPASTNTDTVKTILTAIAQSTLACYSHCTAYTITFDSEDSLIDSFIPADAFSIHLNEDRLSKMKELLSYTKCVMNFQADGAIHIFVPRRTEDAATWVANTAYSLNDMVIPTTPNGYYYVCTTAGTSHATTEPTWTTDIGDTFNDGTVVWTLAYHYEYELGSGNHAFFSMANRKRLVIPNYIEVSSQRQDATQYSGYAVDTATQTTLTASSLSDVRKHYELPITSNAQGTSIATAILSHAQVEAEKGSASVPMNVGAEVYDYVNCIDTRDSDTARQGNILQITRMAAPGQFEMQFSFGSLEGAASALGTFSTIINTSGDPQITLQDVIGELAALWQAIDKITTWIEWANDKLRAIQKYIVDILQITSSIKIPYGKKFYMSGTASGTVFENDLADYTATHDQVTASDYGITGTKITVSNDYTGVVYNIRRARLLFDTSGIPDDAIISAVTLHLYGDLTNTEDAVWNLTIVDGSDLFIGDVSLDYGKLLDNTTSYGTLASGSFVTDAWNNISFTAAGLALIVKAGNTKLGLRSSADISATQPAGENYFQFYSENNPNLAPFLTIEYTTDLSDIIETLETGSLVLPWMGL